MALEPHASALRVYDRGGAPELALRPADLEALHLGTQVGDGSTALYLQGRLVGAPAPRYPRSYGRDALRLVMAEDMAPWLRAITGPRWTVAGERERFTGVWRWWVEVQLPTAGLMHLPPPPDMGLVRLVALVVAVAKAVPKAVPTRKASMCCTALL